MPVPFSRVRELFELHGWRLVRIWKPYFVFWDRLGKPKKLPFLVEVDENKEVSDATYHKIRKYFAQSNDD
jgi:hypothetical protein